MLVATFNATTGWARRQITWQDERFILDGHGPITAADVAEYDRQGQLDWPSEEMHSWLAARLSWEQAVAAPTPAAPAYSQPPTQPASSEPVTMQPASPSLAQPVVAQPLTAPEPVEAARNEQAADEPMVALVTGPPTEAKSGEAEDGPAERAETTTSASPGDEPADEVHDVLVPGGDILDVVGTAPYQAALAMIAGDTPGTTPDVEKWAHLIPEPDNPWDRNAVAVYVDGHKVGYLPRASAPAYAALLGQLWSASRCRAVCRAVVSGGWLQIQSQAGTVTTANEGRLGVRLALAAPQHFDMTRDLRRLTNEELTEGPQPV